MSKFLIYIYIYIFLFIYIIYIPHIYIYNIYITLQELSFHINFKKCVYCFQKQTTIF